jgi:hypothetical protein
MTQPPLPQPEIKQPQISQQLQQALATLNLRIQDMMNQTNTAIQILLAENQQLREQITTLQAPVKQKQD